MSIEIDERVWLNRDMRMQKCFSDQQVTLPRGTCLFLAHIPHACKHLVYVYGALCFDAVPIDAIECQPIGAAA